MIVVLLPDQPSIEALGRAALERSNTLAKSRGATSRKIGSTSTGANAPLTSKAVAPCSCQVFHLKPTYQISIERAAPLSTELAAAREKQRARWKKELWAARAEGKTERIGA